MRTENGTRHTILKPNKNVIRFLDLRNAARELDEMFQQAVTDIRVAALNDCDSDENVRSQDSSRSF